MVGGYEIMGVLNVTPDSFSDGGEWMDSGAAVAHGVAMAREGAAIIDVGGESTRPGAEPVGEAEELARTVPVIERLAAQLRGSGTVISIDTAKAAVAEAALDAGAAYVNDVTAFRGDSSMAELVAARGVRCCVMHMRGEPRTMQDDPQYEDVVGEVQAFLAERVDHAVSLGVGRELIDVDPGIGFGKTAAHNAELLAGVGALTAIGCRVLVGVSRKSFIGRLDGGNGPGDRLPGTIAANVLAYANGARAFRVHDVAENAQALAIAAAIAAAR